MVKVLFTTTPTAAQMGPENDFKQGLVYDLPERSADRWVSRGCAVHADVDASAVNAPNPDAPQVVPLGHNRFNVFAPDGQLLNESPVGKADADALVKSFENPEIAVAGAELAVEMLEQAVADAGKPANPLDHDGDGKPGGSAPAAPGAEVLSAAALLAALESDPKMKNFLTFKAEAKKTLDGEVPATKGEIIKALRAKAKADAASGAADPQA